MKLIDLVKKNRNVILTFEDNQTLFLRYEIFVKNMIVKGDEFNEGKINQLTLDNNLFKLKETAMRYLSRRIHSQKELNEKLQKKKYDKDLINKVINYLIEKEYLNDKDFACRFVKDQINLKKNGIQKIRLLLKQKGIGAEDIEYAVSKSFDEEKDEKNIDYLCRKKINQLKIKNIEPIKLRQKVFSYLVHRGFTFEQVNFSLKNVRINEEN